MHKRISRAAIHFSWYAVVSVIVITTMLVSLIWITSSSVDDLRPKILEWIHTSTGQPVEVESLEIEWRGIIPHLKLSDIDVKDRNSNKRLTHFDQASLSVDLYHSLINWKITVGHLELSGLDVELVQQEDGTISLKGLTDQTSNHDAFTRWLLQQPHLKIIDSQIIWHRPAHDKEQQKAPIRLSEVNLDLKNKLLVETHQLIGSAKLPDESGEFNFQLDITGNPLTKKWDAILNLTTQEFIFSHFLSTELKEKLQTSLLTEMIPPDQSRLSSKTKITWKHADISDVRGHFALKNTARIYAISGNFEVEKTTDNNWRLIAPDLSIASQDHQWQPFQLGLLLPVTFSPDSPSLDIIINKLKIEDLLSVLPESFKTNIIDLQPQGSLDTLTLHYDKKNIQNPFLITGEFSDMKTFPYEKIPGIKNLSGKFQGTKSLLILNLDNHDLVLSSLSKTGELDPPVMLDQLNGTVEWKKLDQGWIISMPQISLSNPDLEFQVTGSIKNDTTSSPELDLEGTFFRGNIAPIVKMIPSNLLQHKVKEWLDRAIVSGRLTGGNVIFRGPLDQFPFDNNGSEQQGIFEVRLNAEDGILDYFEGWPRIEEITAEVVFNSQGMSITSPSAKINNAIVSNTTVEIPEFRTKTHHLLINGNAKGQMQDGLHFINHSPLKKTIGKQLSHLKISGILDLDLNLDIPLSDAHSSKVEGIIHLKKNTLLLKSLDIELKALSGHFIFDQNRWQGKDLKARLYESAISIDLDIDKSDENPKSDVRLIGLADKNYITNRLIQLGMSRNDLKVLESIRGTTSWQAQLSLPSGIGDPDAITGLIITSDLKGLSIHAPHPMGKLSNQERPLRISTTLSKAPKRQIRFAYGEIVQGNIELGSVDSNKTGLQNISLHFGQGKIKEGLGSEHLIVANGTIKTLDLSAWSGFIKKYSTLHENPSSPEENLLKFDLTVEHLKAAGQTFKRNHITGRSSKKTWELQIENDLISGMISIPYLLSNQPVKADFEQLTFVASKNDESINLTPKDIPELFLTSQKFTYNDLQLGSLQLHTMPVNEGLHIEKLVLSTPAVTVDVTGNWLERNKQQSKFKILANGQALDPMLEQFGFTSNGIEGGKTSITINASWPGSPADFDLARLKGSLKLDVGSGRFTEIKNRVGKVFGLLSIQSLGRRLSLDFNDLFKKGFTFDEITGDFDIENGNAYTSNLSMIGPSANINVAGRIGLVEKDYDQLITVTPSVSGSLPIASALFGPIGAGVGAAIYLAEKVVPVIPDTIDKVLEKQYSLKGSWEKPVIETVFTDQKNTYKNPMTRNQ